MADAAVPQRVSTRIACSRLPDPPRTALTTAHLAARHGLRGHQDRRRQLLRAHQRRRLDRTTGDQHQRHVAATLLAPLSRRHRFPGLPTPHCRLPLTRAVHRTTRAVVGRGNSAAQIVADLTGVADTLWCTARPSRYLTDDVDRPESFSVASRSCHRDRCPPSIPGRCQWARRDRGRALSQSCPQLRRPRRAPHVHPPHCHRSHHRRRHRDRRCDLLVQRVSPRASSSAGVLYAQNTATTRSSTPPCR